MSRRGMFRQVSMTAEEIEMVLDGVQLVRGSLHPDYTDYRRFIEKFEVRLRRHLATLKQGNPSMSWPRKPSPQHDVQEDY